MYSKARRALGVCILAFIAIPALLYSYRYVFSPDLYEGDELEERECRHCAGTGIDGQLGLEFPGSSDRCPACRGRGRVQVIIPGPKRPVRVRGLVLDSAKVLEPVFMLREPWRPAHPFETHPAACSRATVTFTPRAGDPITLETNGHGRFLTRLAPGTYTARVRARRRVELRDELEIKPLTAPIWLEKAKILAPLDYEAGRSNHGVEFRAILSKEPEVGEMLLLPAWP